MLRLGSWIRPAGGSPVRVSAEAPGIDRQTLEAVKEHGVERLLAELQDVLRKGAYRPLPARRVEIPSRRVVLGRWVSRVKALTGRGRAGQDIRDVIADLNPVLRGWGNYFRTGNAATKFVQIDYYVVGRLRRLMIKRYGRNLHAGHPVWTREFFEALGFYRLRGTIRYPGVAS